MQQVQQEYTQRNRALQLLTWDGALPLISLSAPWVLGGVLRLDESFVAVISAFAIPMIFACLRTGVAERQLHRICGGKPPLWRRLLLALAIVLLLLFESLANAASCMGNPPASLVWTVAAFYLTYLATMALCLQTRRRPATDRQPETLVYGEIKIPRH